MYDLQQFGDMVADTVRMDANAGALRQAIKPGAVVLDIGAGTGIFTLLACQYGASRVYAVEPNDAIVVAQANVRANGWADRVQFFQERSTRISLPERVDVIISDLRSILPLFHTHLPSIIDARKRFLLPGGVQIPQADRIWVAPVEAPKEYKKLVHGQQHNSYGVNLEAALRYSSNTRHKVKLKPEQLLAEPQSWTTLDYTKLETSNFSETCEWTSSRTSLCHGIVVWFDALLAEGISFSNAPGTPATVYCQTYFPWQAPVDVQKGDKIVVDLKANLVGESYIWRWDSQVIDRECSDRVKSSFQQSDFLSMPRVPAKFRLRSAQFVPTLDEEGEIEQVILSLIDGRTSVQAIARQLCQRFPNRLQREQDAVERVAGVSCRFCK